MWTLRELGELGLDLDPAHNCFTYTFPPPYYAKKHGTDRTPLSFAEARKWPDVSLYLHLPFCRIDCQFCSLHRQLIRDESLVDRYVNALRREIRSFKDHLHGVPLRSIFFGGGTPSALSAGQLGHLLRDLEDCFTVQGPVEVCIECAPDVGRSVSDWHQFFQELVSCLGLRLTRVSFGVQSFDEKTLRSMGRQGGSAAMMDLLRAVDEVIPTYNIDIILGYPEHQSGMSVTTASDTTVAALSRLLQQGFRLPSVSLYQLWDVTTIPIMQRRNAALPSADLVLEAKWQLLEGLQALGYRPSTVTTFVRSKESVHLWAKSKFRDFRHVGLGSGAYSILPREFAQRPRDVDGYIAAVEGDGHGHRLDHCYTLNEYEVTVRQVIMGLRSGGWVTVPASEAVRAEAGLADLNQKIHSLVDAGILQRGVAGIKLSDEAFLIGNEISSYLHPSSYPRQVLA